MDKKFKITTLILGVIIAVLAFSNTRLYAFPMEKEDITDVKEIQIELLTLLEQKIEIKHEEVKNNRCIKFYNERNQLVYECRDKDDERLKVLMRRSDVVLETNTSSYYLLSD